MSKTKYKYTVREVINKFCEKNKGFNRSEIYGTDIEDINSMLQETVSEKWKPESLYYSIGTSGQIVEMKWDGDIVNKWDFKTGNCFPYTKEGKKQAEEYREKLISLNSK